MDELCAICTGDLFVLGALGNMLHLRCRRCGAEFSREQARPCRHCECDALRAGVTCGRSECQEAEFNANRERNAARRKPRRRS